MNASVPASSIIPGSTDRLLAVGATGTGKSSLVRAIAVARKYVVVHDGKGLVSWPGYRLFNSLAELEKNDNPAKFPKIIYRPNRFEKHDEGAKEAFFEWIFERRNTTLIVDEVFQIVQGNALPESYLACLTSGREHHIEVWNCCQRPTRIPPEILGEAEHVYCFRLRLEQDRRKMFDAHGIPAESIRKLPKRFFYYVRNEDDPVGPMQARLPWG